MKKSVKHAPAPGAGASTGMEKSRLAALADGIFSVAMTLLVLDIKLPDNLRLAGSAELWDQLMDLRDRFAVYGFSFAMLGVYWIGHHVHFHFIHRVNRPFLWINLLFLFFISLVPFSTNLLGGHANTQIAVVVYGANLLLIAVTMYANMQYLIWNPGLTAGLTQKESTHIRRRLLLLILLPLVAIILSYFDTRASFWVFVLMLPAFILPGKIDEDMA
jgi:uncharacterized membrane protein